VSAPSPLPGKRPEVVALTGLRAWAALWVVVHHHRVFVEGELGEPWFGLLERGYLGVDVFFTLSGFVIAYNYGGRIRSGADAARFVALRLARIYPLHFATLVILALLAATSGITGLQVGSPSVYSFDRHLFLHLFLVHAWGLESELRFNQPSWSISAEFFAYLWFPLLWSGIARIRHRAPAVAGVIVTTVSMVIVLRLLGYETLHVPVHHALVRASSEFLAGCLLCRLVDLDHGRRLSARLTGILLAAIGLLAVTPAADPWMAPGASLLVYLLAAGSGQALRAFDAAPIRFLGRISYSIYLTHMPVLSGLQRVLPSWELGALPLLPTLGVLVLHAVAILGVATISYQWLELPAREALRRRIFLRRTP
jgi:peptidoglycan/LPS O-acetylase OafA/YrhL